MKQNQGQYSPGGEQILAFSTMVRPHTLVSRKHIGVGSCFFSETTKCGRLPTGTSPFFFRENANLEPFPSDAFVLQNTL